MDIEYYKKFEPIFGAWKIVKLLGEGSFGKVFEIQKEEFGALYRSALKVITIPQNESDLRSAEADGMDEASIVTYYRSFVEDFSRESSIMAKLKGHTNIVSFEDTQIIEHKDSIGWDIFIRMELLTPLNDYLKAQGGRLQPDQIIKLGTDLCKALEVCDKHNIIHRDIKPENIFISDIGDFKLGDFGISRIAEKTSGASTKAGTKDYMAPEVFRGEKYDRSVDTYSLSLVLYKLLNNNRLPFLPPAPQGITFTQRNEALDKRISGVAIPAIPGIDPELSQIIVKGCAFKPADRYQSSSELMNALMKASVNKDIDSSESVTNISSIAISTDQNTEYASTEYESTEYESTEYESTKYTETEIADTEISKTEFDPGLDSKIPDEKPEKTNVESLYEKKDYTKTTDKTNTKSGIKKTYIIAAICCAVLLAAIIIGVSVHNAYEERYSIPTNYQYSWENDDTADTSDTSNTADTANKADTDTDESNTIYTSTVKLSDADGANDEDAVFISGSSSTDKTYVSSGTYIPTISCHYSWDRNITEIIEESRNFEYQNVDIDGDGLTDTITRYDGFTDHDVVDFTFEFGNGTSFTTDEHFSQFPNEGTVVSFNDLDGDNIDEILITHYTDSTAQAVAWDCVMYTYVEDGVWEKHLVVDDHCNIILGEDENGLNINDYLCDVGEISYNGEYGYSYNVRDVEFNGGDGSKPAYMMYLVDFGYKDGPSITYDLDVFMFRYEDGRWILTERSSENGWDPYDWAWPQGI